MINKVLCTMTELELPSEVYTDLVRASGELTGFDSPEELAVFVLEAFCDEMGSELKSQEVSPGEDEAVQERLQQLGYIE